jgi:hypothetical protein
MGSGLVSGFSVDMAVPVSVVLDSGGKRSKLRRLPPSPTTTGNLILMHYPGHGSNPLDSVYKRPSNFV